MSAVAWAEGSWRGMLCIVDATYAELSAKRCDGKIVHL